MSQYSQSKKQEINALERTFSTTIDNDYKQAFIHCKTNNAIKQCNLMQDKLDIVHDNLDHLRSLDTIISSKVDKNKKTITNLTSDLDNQKHSFLNNMSILNTTNNVNQASGPLKQQKKKTMFLKYFYLAYYVLVNLIILYLLYKVHYFSIFNFLSVFLIIIILIFIFKYFGLPYV
jgi:hypothetical protein